uniref:hypothetical protein n=1 Tax=Mycobacterium shinjukuense TaxID=398694 RepID=UPI0018D949C9|nr:hypothetical protein [Mycobacterium shinjukuense]
MLVDDHSVEPKRRRAGRPKRLTDAEPVWLAVAQVLRGACSQRVLREGMVVLADKGPSGAELQRYCAEELNPLLVRPDRKDEKKRRCANLAGMGQWIQAVYDTRKDQLGLKRHGGRTATGVHRRIAAPLLALAAGIWRNWTINADAKRSLIADDH